ncbi:50S ribosomal protein L29 [Candidatus Parcubacteria bacterium]|jgi:ribosomal protein L29|nr:50S ribosomal protein L29 [Candidatus Parcubacteria bacterium]
MTAKEAKKLDINQLNEKLLELRNKSRELRFSIANNQLKDMREFRKNKKDIARILTVLNIKREKAENKTAK